MLNAKRREGETQGTERYQVDSSVDEESIGKSFILLGSPYETL
jgi:hypothetical protein